MEINESNVSEQVKEANTIAEAMSNLRIDTEGIENEELQEDVYNFYLNRFKMFVEDDAVIAVNAYLAKVAADPSINKYTKLVIMKRATEAMCGELNA